jgi:hypothetical protein
MKYFFKQNKKKYEEVLAQHNLSLLKFLTSYKKYIIFNKDNITIKRKETKLFNLKVEKELYFSFMLVCYSFQIDPKKILDVFIKLIINADQRLFDIIEILKDYDDENDSFIFKDRRNEMTNLNTLFKKMEEHNMNKNDIKKYINVQSDNLEF